MKTKFLILIAFIFLSFYSWSQPEKGSWSIGGSGYRIKIYDNKELFRKAFEINAEANYFIYRNFALGGSFIYKGNKDYSLANNDRFHGLFIAPTVEAYILNKEKYGISIKGTMNVVLSTNWDIEKNITSYMFGPKVSWNITPFLSTFLWGTYKRLEEYDTTTNYTTRVPSDNFDIRWGFSYLLHKKKAD